MRGRSNRIGQIVMGRYRIVRPLAQGGMGLVYLTRIEGAQGFVRPAVIKQMLPDLLTDRELVRLFVREARILSELRHPGVVSVLDFSVDKGAYLMALEYVHGYHAGHWLKYHRRNDRLLDPELAIYVVCRVLDALDYVHARTDEKGRSLGIVHRDVSPSNVLIDVEGRVRLVDFGVARVEEDVSYTNGQGVTIKGKLAYVAPELLRGDKPTAGSDIFACGVVLHEFLSGRNELRAPSPTETFQRLLHHDLSPLEIERDDLPAGVDAIIGRAVSRDPDARFPSAGAMAAALRQLLPQGDRELESRLAAAARRDFVHGVPDALRLPRLDELERAWREPVATPADLPLFEPDRSEAPTLPDGHRSPTPTSVPPPPATSPRWLLAGLAVLALAGAALGALALFGAREPAAGSVVVVDRRSMEPPPPALDPALPPAGSGGTPAPPEVEPPESEREPSTRARSAAARLTRTVHARRAAIEACFTAHSGTSDRRRVSVRFRIDRDGSVRGADLDPAELTATPLGSCLLRVARGTRFERQPREVSFSIPITVDGGG